jgi:AraC-like DNA-binding protein
MASPTLALDRVRIDRVLSNTVEIAEASPADRRFPDRVSDTLGVCWKLGPEHDVQADGHELRYPADAVCVRAPGCVWATRSTGSVGFLSFDIEAAALPEAGVAGRMSFVRKEALPDLTALAHVLRSPAALLEKQGAVAELVGALLEQRLVSCSDIGEGGDSPHAVRRARELLLARLEDPPSLEVLSAEVGCNRFVLIRRFRRAFGVSPHAFSLCARIERSRALLVRGVEAAEVAFSLGFADQSHFSRTFKSIVGLTPGAYRKRARRVAGAG